MDQLGLLRFAALLVVCGLFVAAWMSTPIATLDLHDVSAWLAPHRRAWYARPMVMIASIVADIDAG